MVDPRQVNKPKSGGRTYRKVALAYVDTRRKKKVVPSTVERYLECLRLHVFPVIGNMDINEIGSEDIREVLDRASKKLAPSSLRVLHSSVLFPVFKWAIDSEWRERANPCQLTARELSHEINEQPILLPDDAPAFLTCAYALAEPGPQGEKPIDPDGLAGDFFALLQGTGFRWQEGAALDVDSVDWKRRVVVVRQVLRYKVGLARDKGKSRAAFRDFPLPDSDDDPLVELLMRRTKGRRGHEPLFATRRGTRIYADLARHLLREAADLAEREHGITGVRGFHSFRRGFATTLEDREIPENSLKLVLGHVRHTGATARYVRLTRKQIENIRPYIGGIVPRVRREHLGLAA
nr:tyrosine-type recombinase/integrase [Actinomadura rayongensis]